MAFLVGEDKKSKAGSMDVLAGPGSFENLRKTQMAAVQPDQNVRKFQAQQPNPEDEKKPKYADGDIVEDEEAEDNAAATQLTGSIGGASGGTAAPSTGGPSAGGSKSGGFANIQQYLEANKPKVEQITSDITSGVQKEAADIRSGLGQSREKYLGQEGVYGAGSKDFVGQQIGRAGSGTSTDEQKQRFSALRTGSDAGPSFDKERQRAQNLEQRAKDVSKEGGRFSEVERIVGKQSPQYSAGQKSLDQLLIGSAPGYSKAIRDIQESTKGLSGQVGQLGQDITSGRQELKTQTQSEIDAARGALQGTVKDRYGRLKSGLEAGQLSQEDLASLGLQAGQRTYGTNLSGVLEGTRGMTPEEASRLDALAGLGGLEGRQLYTNVQGGDVAADMQQRIAEQKGLYEGELNPLQSKTAAEQGLLSRIEDTRMLERSPVAGNDQYSTYSSDPDLVKFMGGGGYDYDRATDHSQARFNVAKSARLADQNRRAAQQETLRKQLESRYGGNIAQAEDGGVINPKLAALKKLSDH